MAGSVAHASPPPAPGDRLQRRLGTADAVVIGLASMMGAGVFAAVGPAAAAAGTGLLVGLAIAAVVAWCNATSSAQLAALYPESGGTYVYGRERLGPFWGYLAGWGFVAGKTASCAAMALTAGAYAAPQAARPIAVGAVVALTAVNLRGIRRTAATARVLVALVLASLAAVVAAALLGGRADAGNLGSLTATGGADGILEAAGLLFFAFAGYARIATLGEEVADPERTIPRAITLALGIALAVYAVVALSALLAVGAQGLAAADAPLAAAARAGSLDWLAPAVAVGGTLAALGALLSMIAGVSRTALAMARRRELPGALDAVHPRHHVPHRAELAVAAVVLVAVVVADLRTAIGFSAFTVLAYYAVTNAAAWTLRPHERRRPRALAALGVVGCVLLAVTLPAGAALAGAGVMAAGALAWPVLAARAAV